MSSEAHWFVGAMPAADYKGSDDHWYVHPISNPVQVQLTDGTVHAYYGHWSTERYDQDGRKLREEDGWHRYALSGTGELHIVKSVTITHLHVDPTRTEMIEQESIEITYATHAWRWATGPHGEVPVDERQTRTFPNRPAGE